MEESPEDVALFKQVRLEARDIVADLQESFNKDIKV